MKIFAVFVLCYTIFTLVNGDGIFGTMTQGFQTVRQKSRCNLHKFGSTVFQHQHGHDPCQEPGSDQAAGYPDQSPDVTEIYNYITTPRFNVGRPEENWKPESDNYKPDVNFNRQGSFEPERNLLPEVNLKPKVDFKPEWTSKPETSSIKPEKNVTPVNRIDTSEDVKPVSEDSSVSDHGTTEKTEEDSLEPEILDHSTTPGQTIDVRSNDGLSTTTAKSTKTFATVPHGKRIINAGSNCPEGSRGDTQGNCREEYK